MMRKTITRWVLYLVGMVILAVGIVLNTKTGLGSSAVLSLPFSISEIWGLNLGNVTFVVYVVFIAVQMLLKIRTEGKKKDGKLGVALVKTALQLPFSLIFTRGINLVSAWIPVLSQAYAGQFMGTLAGRLLAVLVAAILTGIGAALTLDMHLVPNPTDGIVQTLAETIGKRVGFTKNCFDALCVGISIILGLVTTGGLVCVGVGTIVATFGVGRVIALFHHLCGDRVRKLAGL